MKQPKLFADLHVHPHYFKYWDIRWDKHHDIFDIHTVSDDDRTCIESIIHNAELHRKRMEAYPEYRLGSNQEINSKDNVRRAERAAMGGDYSQSNPIQMRKAKAKLAVVSLSPVERGWFIGNQASHLPHKTNVFRKLLMHKTSSWEFRYASKFTAPEYNYYHEMLREYFYYISEHAYETAQLNSTDTGIKGRAAQLVESGRQMQSVVDSPIPLFLFSLESLYILSQKPVLATDGKNVKLETVDVKQVLHRIHLLKQKDLFPHPFLYITYSHHFASGYAGHTKSLPELFFGKPPANQSHKLYEGLSENISENIAIISKLLSLDDFDSIPLPEVYKSTAQNLLYNTRVQAKERRILIDIKHMPAKGRKEYYEWFIKPHLKKPEDQRIPVLATHMGYSGIDGLHQFHSSTEVENNDAIQYRIVPGMNPSLVRDSHCSLLRDKVPFLTWGINLCDEDIAIILKSRGLIGLCFDQRILGCVFNPIRTGFGDKILGHTSYPEAVGFGYLWGNILAMAWRAFEMCKTGQYDLNAQDADYVWKMFTLGTDFDGLIDPPYGFATVEQAYPKFANMAFRELSHLQQNFNETYQVTKENIDISVLSGKQNDIHAGADAILERICWLNLYEFVQKQWVKTSGEILNK
jgi:hypothetical protein